MAPIKPENRARYPRNTRSACAAALARSGSDEA